MVSVRQLSVPLVVAAVLALGAVVGFQKIRDFDYWWHARTGRLIAETGAIPTQDVFTYSVPGNRWIDIHWLFQLGLHGVRSLGGHDAVVVAKVVLVSALAALLLAVAWRHESAFLAALAVGLALLVAGDRMMARPELPSFLLLAALLWLIDRHERLGGRAIYAAVPITLLWANLHGLFAVGLVVLAIALVAELLRPLVVAGAAWRRDRLVPLAATLVLSIGVTFLNPNGVDGMLYPIDQLRMVGAEQERNVFGSVIAELLPPFGHELPMNPFARALLAALAAIAGGSMLLNWRRVSAFDPLACVAFGWLALGAHRNVALFALVAAAVAARNASALLARRPLAPAAQSAANLVVAAALLVAVVDVARDRFFLRIGSSRETGLGTFDLYYPVAAVDWIARERPPGPIAHHMADGGYLAFRLWPEYRVLADGRLEVYGPEEFARLQITGPDSFRSLDERFRFGSVLVHYSLTESGELLHWLHLNPNWRLVHVDEVAALFVRATPEASRWPAVDIDAPDLFPPLSDERSPSDRLRHQARLAFYVALRRFGPALAVSEASLARYPDVPGARRLHAWLLAENGFQAAAEALLRQELDAAPEDVELLTRLADLRWTAGDAAQARDALDRALAVEPNHLYALSRRLALAEAEGDHARAAELRARLQALATMLGAR
jgi:tetratricopeptide (TPR) repeat protein